ncbi:MAG: hypothetical protein V2J25_04880 [Desulfatiglans sp.]|nr:hypothetical protein [Thermodesulfobacteriota bacterium]MEE4352186.1 hypothetical protein [Desulfatiglans sp.]
MKNRNLGFVFAALLLSFSLASSSAWAGSRHNGRLEGIAIGVGAAIIGGALLHHYSHDHHTTVHYHSSTPPYYDPPPWGHWEIKRIWIAPTHKRYWLPGHHNHRGYWVPGRWAYRVDRPGFWKEKRIWVSDGPRKRRPPYYYTGRY